MAQPGLCRGQDKTVWSTQSWSKQQRQQKGLLNCCNVVITIVTVKSEHRSLFYVDLTWDGPDPSDRVICPYAVEFYCKPSPAESLNSLESGRILFELQLGADVRSVIGRLLNRAKSENLDKLQDGASKIKRQDRKSTRLNSSHANIS